MEGLHRAIRRKTLRTRTRYGHNCSKKGGGYCKSGHHRSSKSTAIFPNFYVTYNRNPAPLTRWQKFSLALLTNGLLAIAGDVMNNVVQGFFLQEFTRHAGPEARAKPAN